MESSNSSTYSVGVKCAGHPDTVTRRAPWSIITSVSRNGYRSPETSGTRCFRRTDSILATSSVGEKGLTM